MNPDEEIELALVAQGASDSLDREEAVSRLWTYNRAVDRGIQSILGEGEAVRAARERIVDDAFLKALEDFAPPRDRPQRPFFRLWLAWAWQLAQPLTEGEFVAIRSSRGLVMDLVLREFLLLDLVMFYQWISAIRQETLAPWSEWAKWLGVDPPSVPVLDLESEDLPSVSPEIRRVAHILDVCEGIRICVVVHCGEPGAPEFRDLAGRFRELVLETTNSPESPGDRVTTETVGTAESPYVSFRVDHGRMFTWGNLMRRQLLVIRRVWEALRDAGRLA